MTTLRVGIASYKEMKAMTLAVARGQRKLAPREPRIWFPSTESFARVLSAGNRDLLRLIAEKAPGSLEELSQLSGRREAESFSHAQDHGQLRSGPPGARTPRTHCPASCARPDRTRFANCEQGTCRLRN